MTIQNKNVQEKTNVYGPKVRDYLEVAPREIKAYSETPNDYSILPDNVQDPIVSNNISNMEFDYTYGDVLKTPEDED